MSCITIIGMEKYWNTECDVPLTRTSPPWTKSKVRRLEQFATSTDPALRAVAAEHPRLPSNRLLMLLSDKDVQVRRAAVKNVSITPAMLSIALHDADPGVVAYARLISEDGEDV